jgi:hypothetical protein
MWLIFGIAGRLILLSAKTGLSAEKNFSEGEKLI